MLTVSNLFETLARLKFFIYELRTSNGFLVYEAMPEEDLGVKKKIAKFDDFADAEMFYEKLIEEYVKFLKERFNMRNKNVKTEPPSIKSIKDSCRRCSEDGK